MRIVGPGKSGHWDGTPFFFNSWPEDEQPFYGRYSAKDLPCGADEKKLYCPDHSNAAKELSCVISMSIEYKRGGY